MGRWWELDWWFGPVSGPNVGPRKGGFVRQTPAPPFSHPPIRPPTHTAFCLSGLPTQARVCLPTTLPPLQTFHLTKDVDGVLAHSAAYLKGGLVSDWMLWQSGLVMTLLSFVLVASVILSLALSMSQCKFESQKGNSVPIQR